MADGTYLRIVRAVLRDGATEPWLSEMGSIAALFAPNLDGLVWVALATNLDPDGRRIGMITSAWRDRAAMEGALPDWRRPLWPPTVDALVESWTVEGSDIVGAWSGPSQSER